MGTDPLTALEQKVLDNLDPAELVAFLQMLIRSRSDHPPGDCREAIALVEEKLSGVGLNFDRHVLEDEKPNLIASFGPAHSGRSLLLHAHIDTVPAGNENAWAHPPFNGEVAEGRIYGRGAGDDKGSVAAQVMAVIALARAGVDLNGRIQVAIVSDEESGGLAGTKWLYDLGMLRPDFLVVGEQTQNRVAIAERVACGIDLTVFGKNAHGAMPWAGENAVLKAAGALTYLQKELFPALAARKSGVLPPPTLNIGTINGGIQWSIVPDRCKVEMDRRLLPGETREGAMAEIRVILDRYSAEVESLRYELFSTGEVAANIDTPPDDPFVQAAQAALASLAREERPLTGYAQTSDGRWFAEEGIPIIIFGPGDPGLAHTVDEYVPVGELVEAARFLILLTLRWLGAG